MRLFFKLLVYTGARDLMPLKRIDRDVQPCFIRRIFRRMTCTGMVKVTLRIFPEFPKVAVYDARDASNKNKRIWSLTFPAALIPEIEAYTLPSPQISQTFGSG